MSCIHWSHTLPNSPFHSLNFPQHYFHRFLCPPVTFFSGVGDSPLAIGMLTNFVGLILCKSCAWTKSSATSWVQWPYYAQKGALHGIPQHAPAFTCFPSPLPWCILSLWRGGFLYRCLMRGWALGSDFSQLFDKLCVSTLTTTHYKKKLFWPRLKEVQI